MLTFLREGGGEVQCTWSVLVPHSHTHPVICFSLFLTTLALITSPGLMSAKGVWPRRGSSVAKQQCTLPCQRWYFTFRYVVFAVCTLHSMRHTIHVLCTVRCIIYTCRAHMTLMMSPGLTSMKEGAEVALSPFFSSLTWVLVTTTTGGPFCLPFIVDAGLERERERGRPLDSTLLLASLTTYSTTCAVL